MNIHEVLTQTDWPLLARQKAALVDEITALHVSHRQLIEAGEKSAADLALDHCNALDGLLNWIDHVQDAAELGGYPVVFLTEAEEEERDHAQ